MKHDVHTEHCCLRHGCKYSCTTEPEECTVVSGREPQSFPCEMCNIRPNLPHLTVLELMRKLINFPRPEICKHSVVCDLLSALEAEGMPVSEDLAGAVVNADDEGSLAILDKAIENCKKELEFVDWAAYGGV